MFFFTCFEVNFYFRKIKLKEASLSFGHVFVAITGLLGNKIGAAWYLFEIANKFWVSSAQKILLLGQVLKKKVLISLNRASLSLKKL